MSIQRISSLFIAFLLLVTTLFIFSFTRVYAHLQQENINTNFERILTRNRETIDQDILQAKQNLVRLKGYVSLLDSEMSQEDSLAYLKKMMAENLQFNTNQYNSYFAFEKEKAKQYFDQDGYILTVHKNPEQLGTAAYGKPENAIAEVWTDPSYQSNLEEIWYHIAKRSKTVELSPVYFDATYMKTWLYTVGIGFYEAGKFQGMVGIDILLDSFFKLVEDMNIGQGGGVFLADSESGLVFTRVVEANGKQGLLKIPERLSVSLYEDEENKKNWSTILNNNVSQSLVAGVNGQKYLVSSQKLEQLPLTVVAYGNKLELEAVLYRNLLIFISIGIFLLGGVTIISFIFIHKITVPISSLIDAMKLVIAQKTVSESPEGQGMIKTKVPIGGTIETRELGKIFNSMALFINQALQEKDNYSNQLKKLNLGLENKVEERTAELAKANQEITELYERLKTENLRMSAELDITRRLQQMLLPKEDELNEITGLEIAGFMEPASEVGGDYYDILSHDGKIQIGIGDVTGHGLESGVLMIMVQTAVKTLIAHNETDPVKFFDTLNRTIYENVKRMKTDKNLTLALLDYQKGMLRLSGQHEEVIVVRTNGKIERFDTIDLGFPIGLEFDIAKFVASTQVHLNAGDGVVLYTDGITEAENLYKVQYGLERLCQVLSDNWSSSASEIRQAVIENLRSHIGEQKVYDDITLIVMKQK